MIAPRRLSAARERRLWSARNGATFSQQLFVDLRRAGWPVSPVLEGRVQIGGRSFRLLGIEPVTLPIEVGNAPAIGKANLQSFLDAAGRNAGGARGACPISTCRKARHHRRAAARCCRRCACRRSSCRACWWSISASRNGCCKKPDQISRLLIGTCQGQARAARKYRRRPSSGWSSRIRRAIWNASPTAFIST